MADGPKIVGRIGPAPPQGLPPEKGTQLIAMHMGTNLGVGIAPLDVKEGDQIPGVVLDREGFENWVHSARKLKGWW